MSSVSASLLEVLACPKCKGSVKQINEEIVCQGTGCGLRFPIRNGIPVMLIEEAKK